jgi:hypothetical protein
MKKTAIGVVLVFALALGLFFYYVSGGFNEIVVERKNLGQIKLSGIHFRGTPLDESLKDAFLTIETLAQVSEDATLHTIYFLEPAGKMDTLEVFVGLESKWHYNQEGLTTVDFDGSSAIVASIKAHRFVMPGPEKVKNKIREFAKKNKLEEPDLFIDQIVDSDLVRVIGIQNKSNN